MQRLTNFINGRQVGATSGAVLEVVEPATGKVIAEAPASDERDVNSAVEAAKGAFNGWNGAGAAERSKVLLRLAELIERNIEELAQAESRDTGKPIALARSVDIPRSAANLRFFATAVLHTQGEMHEFEGGGVPRLQGGGGGGGSGGGVHAINYTLRRARGVAGLVSPWNLPLYLLTWKIAPALATGNTAVCKPSEVTPLTAWMLGALAQEAGVPAGVLNIVHGRGAEAGAAIVKHPDVPTISFTGSTAVGRWIGREAGERLKRVSLELGGKNPFVVFDDADVEEAVNAAGRAAFTNQGQICLCGSRMIVHERVADEFVRGLVERAKGLVIGDPSDERTQFGSLVSAEHLAKVEGCVEAARRMGGRVLCGGARVEPGALTTRCAGGAFYSPTVIDGLSPTCSVEQEEIFGPVVTVQRFSDFEEAIRLANGTNYGLAATVFTKSLERAHRASAMIESGIVWVNCWMVRDLRTAFGGMKQSGVGREGGLEAIKFFTEAKNVCVRV